MKPLDAVNAWAAGVVTAALYKGEIVGLEVVGADMHGGLPKIIVRIGPDRFGLSVEYLGPGGG